jgi:hypothetical protein
MREDEHRAWLWLIEENPIQRNKVLSSSGRQVVQERDASGGLHALIQILKSGEQINQDIRDALAAALDPIDDSILILKKRPRLGRGRPTKAGEVEGIYNAFSRELLAKDAEEKIRRMRPVPAVGLKATPPRKKEIAAELGHGITTDWKLRQKLKEIRSNQPVIGKGDNS